MFDVHTKIKDIVFAPEFKGFEYMCGSAPGVLGSIMHMLSLSALEKCSGLNAQSIADGMNLLSSRAKAGKALCKIYSDTEIEAEPSKALAGIAAFPLNEKRPFVIVCSGGGYASVSSLFESYPAVKVLNDMGYAAFSLHYRCGKNAAVAKPMEDLAHAIRFVLEHAGELNVSTEGYCVMGFSAGGHLAASFGTESIGYKYYGLPKPAALILSYPVITMGEKTHAGSQKCLLGKHPDTAMIKQYSIEQQVTAAYPPTYLWQFTEDATVPVDNSRMMAESLNQNGIPYQYELFPGKLHGTGLSIGFSAEGWLEQAVEFWNKNK